MPARHPLDPSIRLATALFGSLTVLFLLTACDDADQSVAPGGTPQFTMGSGTTPTLLGRATFDDPSGPPLDIKRITGDWHVQIKAKSGLDLAVQDIVFQPGGFSGWHTHPGPVFIQVISGTMTFYESDDPACTPIVRTVGQGYLDLGEHAHIARNETNEPSENLVVYFAPPGGTGTAGLRIDADPPGNCPF
jgi:hypothetical protein